jgi:hypothetical protein
MQAQTFKDLPFFLVGHFLNSFLNLAAYYVKLSYLSSGCLLLCQDTYYLLTLSQKCGLFIAETLFLAAK